MIASHKVSSQASWRLPQKVTKVNALNLIFIRFSGLLPLHPYCQNQHGY